MHVNLLKQLIINWISYLSIKLWHSANGAFVMFSQYLLRSFIAKLDVTFHKWKLNNHDRTCVLSYVMRNIYMLFDLCDAWRSRLSRNFNTKGILLKLNIEEHIVYFHVILQMHNWHILWVHKRKYLKFVFIVIQIITERMLILRSSDWRKINRDGWTINNLVKYSVLDMRALFVWNVTKGIHKRVIKIWWTTSL